MTCSTTPSSRATAATSSTTERGGRRRAGPSSMPVPSSSRSAPWTSEAPRRSPSTTTTTFSRSGPRIPQGTASAPINHYRVLAPWSIVDPKRQSAIRAVRRPRPGDRRRRHGQGRPGRGRRPRPREAPSLRPATTRRAGSSTGPGSGSPARRPSSVRTLARDRHRAPDARWHESYAYLDGTGEEVLTKAQAEPGPAPARDAEGRLVHGPDGSLVLAEVAQRWVGSGRTVYDSRGRAVRSYEPFFSSTFEYEDEADLVRFGVVAGRALRPARDGRTGSTTRTARTRNASSTPGATRSGTRSTRSPTARWHEERQDPAAARRRPSRRPARGRARGDADHHPPRQPWPRRPRDQHRRGRQARDPGDPGRGRSNPDAHRRARASLVMEARYDALGRRLHVAERRRRREPRPGGRLRRR